MAASITTKSTTLEGQLFEVLLKLQSLEAATSGTTAQNRMRLSIDTDTLSASFSGSLDVALTVDNSGSAVFVPKVYL